MNRRINVTLPSETLELIDRIVNKGDRSCFINDAVKYYIAETEKTKLKEQLKQGAINRAKRDLELAEAWFGFEDEAWLEERK